MAAVREIWEETGERSHLGRRLGEISYPIPEGTKVVHYWAARALGGEFTANREVDDLEWLPVTEASARLTYPGDRKMLDKFSEHPGDTQTVLIVRHGTAGVKSRYSGDDRGRPLDKNGRAQAESLVGQLMAFGATDVYAADRAGCAQTVEPLAQELGVPISAEPDLTEEAYAADPKPARDRVLEIAARGGTPVICTQGKVIPYLLAWWRDGDEVSRTSPATARAAPGWCHWWTTGSWRPTTSPPRWPPSRNEFKVQTHEYAAGTEPAAYPAVILATALLGRSLLGRRPS